MNQLKVYLDKFRNRLKTEHLLHIKRLIGLLTALEKYANEWKASHEKPLGHGNSAMEVMTSGELMSHLGRKVEGVNLLEIERYLRDSKVRGRTPRSIRHIDHSHSRIAP